MEKQLEEKICKIINSHSGCNIGTGLQESLETKIKPLLPPNFDYEFRFNMSGYFTHIFYENGKVYAKISN